MICIPTERSYQVAMSKDMAAGSFPAPRPVGDSSEDRPRVLYRSRKQPRAGCEGRRGNRYRSLAQVRVDTSGGRHYYNRLQPLLAAFAGLPTRGPLRRDRSPVIEVVGV